MPVAGRVYDSENPTLYTSYLISSSKELFDLLRKAYYDGASSVEIEVGCSSCGRSTAEGSLPLELIAQELGA